MGPSWEEVPAEQVSFLVHCVPSTVRCARIGMDTLFSRSTKRTSKGNEHKTYTYKTQAAVVTYWGEDFQGRLY